MALIYIRAAPQQEHDYRADVERSGTASLFRQAFVERQGHCNFTPAELIASLEALAGSLNEKRAARTIELAEKGSIKMLAPVALVMFPVALLIVVAPLVGTALSLLGQG